MADDRSKAAVRILLEPELMSVFGRTALPGPVTKSLLLFSSPPFERVGFRKLCFVGCSTQVYSAVYARFLLGELHVRVASALGLLADDVRISILALLWNCPEE